MRTDNKFYGEAIREIERGIRRDDLWGKAVVKSSGDAQRSHSIYVELLAQQMAVEDGQPSKQQQLEHIQKKASNTLKSIFGWLICVICCIALAVGGTQLGLKFYYENQYQMKLSHRPEQINAGLHELQDNLSSKGIHVTFEQLQEDWSLTLWNLQQKYPLEAAMSINTFYSKVSSWDYYDRVDSKFSSDTEAEIMLAVFLLLLGGSVLWWRDRRKT
ncbi:hypothetical protein FZI02_16780 [Cronobacter sakazakii]|nr:hypothetical protein [Cronobacter sakazakii]KAB0836784.1 hypothetical protein FZI02_16780 [Cronobacter sakazakii]KAB0841991.1 hypothetical protein FZI45_15980 [Cronobacter sakazakii]